MDGSEAGGLAKGAREMATQHSGGVRFRSVSERKCIRRGGKGRIGGCSAFPVRIGGGDLGPYGGSPGPQAAVEGGCEAWVQGDQVLCFAYVVVEVVELDLARFESLDQLPVAHADDAGGGLAAGEVVGKVPVDGVAVEVFGTGEEGHEAGAVDGRGGFGAGQVGEGREEVDGEDGLGARRAGVDEAGHAGDEGDADAALIEHALAAAEWGVGCDGVAAVVGGEEDQGVLGEVELFEEGGEAADALVVYKTNPHIDRREGGVEAATILARTVRGQVRPTMALAKPELVFNIYFHNTSVAPMQPLMAQAIDLERKMRQATFDLDDFLQQLQQLKRMGPLAQVMEMIPGFSAIKNKLPAEDLDEGNINRVEAIIYSMTPQERQRPSIIGGSRRRRIARGSGTTPQDVNQLLNQFKQMQKMMRQMSSGKGPKNLMRMFGG